MANYDANIRIGVTGQGELDAAVKKINRLQEAINGISGKLGLGPVFRQTQQLSTGFDQAAASIRNASNELQRFIALARSAPPAPVPRFGPPTPRGPQPPVALLPPAPSPLQGRSPRLPEAPRSTGNFNALLDRLAGATTSLNRAQALLRALPENRITTDLAGRASAQRRYFEEAPGGRAAAAASRYFDPVLKEIAQTFARYSRELRPTANDRRAVGPLLGQTSSEFQIQQALIREATKQAFLDRPRAALPPAREVRIVPDYVPPTLTPSGAWSNDRYRNYSRRAPVGPGRTNFWVDSSFSSGAKEVMMDRTGGAGTLSSLKRDMQEFAFKADPGRYFIRPLTDRLGKIYTELLRRADIQFETTKSSIYFDLPLRSKVRTERTPVGGRPALPPGVVGGELVAPSNGIRALPPGSSIPASEQVIDVAAKRVADAAQDFAQATQRGAQRVQTAAAGGGGGRGFGGFGGGGGGGGFGGGGGGRLGGGSLGDFPLQGPVPSGLYRAGGRRGGGSGSFNLTRGIQESLIGGAFPLLFGAGPISSAGGLIGGAAGAFGPGAGFAGGLVGSLVGQFGDKLTALGVALKSPTDALDALKEVGIELGDSTRNTVQALVEAGRGYDAQTAILEQLRSLAGTSYVNNLTELGNKQQQLAEEWTRLSALIQDRLLPAFISFTQGVTNFVKFLEGQDLARRSRDIDKNQFQRDVQAAQAVGRKAGGFNAVQAEQRELARLSALRVAEYERRQAGSQELSRRPLSDEDKRKALDAQVSAIGFRRQQAQELRSLENGVVDMRREAEDKIFELRRRGADIELEKTQLRQSIEDEIFRRRQEVARLQAENTRSQRQLGIERTDLALAQRAEQIGGPGAEFLDRVREYLRIKGEGEANLQLREKQIQLEIAQDKREVGKFELQVADRVRAINRQVEDYSRDVTRFEFDTERKIGEYKIKVEEYLYKQLERRYQMAASYEAKRAIAAELGAFDVGPGGAGGAGGGRKTLMGVPGVVEYLTGDPSSSGYDRSHAGGNYHEHIAFTSQEKRDIAMAALRAAGIQIGSVNSGRHAPNSYHYSNQAFDVPAAQVPVGQEQALSQRVRDIVARAMGGAMRAASAGPGALAAQVPMPGPAAKPPAPPSLPSLPQAPAPVGFQDLSAIVRAQEQKSEELQKELEIQRQLEAVKASGALLALTSNRQVRDRLIAAQEELLNVRSLLDLNTSLSDQEQERQRIQLENAAAANILDQALADSVTEARRLYESNALSKEVFLQILGSLQERKDLEEEILKNKEAQLLIEQEQARNVIAGNNIRELNLAGRGASRGLYGGGLEKYNEAFSRTGNEAFAMEQARVGRAADLRGQIGEIRANLNQLTDPAQAVITQAKGIGDAFATAFTDITSGSKSAKEALADMFKSIANNFLNMAAQILAQQAVLSILGMFGGALGGGGGGGGGGLLAGGGILNGSLFGGGFNIPSVSYFAEGGFATHPTPAVVAEGGESEYIIPSSKMGAAMARYSAGARGDAVLEGPDGIASGGDGSSWMEPTINVTTGGILRFEGADYVRQEDFQAGLRTATLQGAKMGEQRTIRRMQQSPGTRRRLGL